MVALDAARLGRTLGDPALARVVRRLARRLELGRLLESDFTLENVTEAERLALGRLLGRQVSLRGRSLRVSPVQLSVALSRAGLAPDLRTAVETLTGPVTSRAEAAAAESAGRDMALAMLAAGRYAGTDWYEQWSRSLQGDGTLTRLVRSESAWLIEQAVAVLDELPADMLPLPVLAERATGDTKALSETAVSRMVLRALALREPLMLSPDRSGQGSGSLRAMSRADVRRALWESAGAIPDDLASQVLVLGISAVGTHPLGRWLSEAAEAWIPFRVTLHQLVTMPVKPTVARVFVCENPSVLRAAASARTVTPSGPRAVGSGSAVGTALMCTEGVASAACHRLLAAIAGTGAVISWRGDFDWTGLRAVAAAVDRYEARPWRMGLADYEAALAAGTTERLRGPASASPWDPPLAARMTQTGRAVMEERLIPVLLADLAANPAG